MRINISKLIESYTCKNMQNHIRNCKECQTKILRGFDNINLGFYITPATKAKIRFQFEEFLKSGE